MADESIQEDGQSVQVIATTLAGREIIVDGLTEKSRLSELRAKIAEVFESPPFTVKLFINGENGEARILEDFSVCLLDAGLVAPSASVCITRVPGPTGSDSAKLLEELCGAIRANDISSAKKLIDEGAGFNSEGALLKSNDNTVLHLAIREKLVSLCLYLIAMGVDVNLQNDAGRAALAQATIRGLPSVVSALMNAGAEVSARDASDRTALYYALFSGNDDLAAHIYASVSLADERTSLAYLGLARGCPFFVSGIWPNSLPMQPL